MDLVRTHRADNNPHNLLPTDLLPHRCIQDRLPMRSVPLAMNGDGNLIKIDVYRPAHSD